MAERSGRQPKGVRGPAGRPGEQRPAQRTSRPRASIPVPPAGSSRPGIRGRLERTSLPILIAMRRVPTWLVVVLMALFLFAGLVIPIPWLSALMLLLVAVFLGWLLLLSWPVLGSGSRLLRLFVVGALLVVAFLRVTGGWA